MDATNFRTAVQLRRATIAAAVAGNAALATPAARGVALAAARATLRCAYYAARSITLPTAIERAAARTMVRLTADVAFSACSTTLRIDNYRKDAKWNSITAR